MAFRTRGYFHIVLLSFALGLVGPIAAAPNASFISQCRNLRGLIKDAEQIDSFWGGVIWYRKVFGPGT